MPSAFYNLIDKKRPGVILHRRTMLNNREVIRANRSYRDAGKNERWVLCDSHGAEAADSPAVGDTGHAYDPNENIPNDRSVSYPSAQRRHRDDEDTESDDDDSEGDAISLVIGASSCSILPGLRDDTPAETGALDGVYRYEWIDQLDGGRRATSSTVIRSLRIAYNCSLTTAKRRAFMVEIDAILHANSADGSFNRSFRRVS
jgi:hypothetical protein